MKSDIEKLKKMQWEVFVDKEGHMKGKTNFEECMKLDTPGVLKALRKKLKK